ncbi:MAG: dihydrolipoyl dehydrogenase [Sulfobacillus benefaciens]|uniref:Dihydrolipoyl dehydrogenase n=1 Tax=Sulfobacillus benefaciens TaxID=453960 RepID=A0A2T2WT61_9FIRM|nr:MAG: dihydrolipoyl dehydrogenase [Sulfobacillus benefaciens]
MTIASSNQAAYPQSINLFVKPHQEGEPHVNKIFDVVVIGGGGGGYPAALRIAHSGRSVLMIDEKGNLGGNCLFEGCVPSKAVREAAALAMSIRGAEYFGLEAEIELPRWDRIRAYKDRIQTHRYAQHQSEIEEAALLTMVRGVGRFVTDHNIAVEDWDRETTEVVTGHHIIVATGSEIKGLEIPGAEYIWNSHHLFAWHEAVRELPLDVTILGGGYIGVETASMLSSLGIHVTLLEMAPSILPGMDQDLIKVVAGHMSQRGVKIETGVRVEGVSRVAGGQYRVSGHRVFGNRPAEWVTQQVIQAVGRSPSLPADLGLEKAGVDYTAKGIVVDGTMRTNVPHIYAPGDVNGLSMLFHSAVRMSEIVAHEILRDGHAEDTFNPKEMPQTVFADPEAMSVGFTADEARSAGIKVWEETRPMGVEAKAQIMGNTEGFLKMVVSRQNGEIIGMQAVGIDAADLSSVAHVAVKMGLTPRDIARMTFAHPTQFEVVDRLARSI